MSSQQVQQVPVDGCEYCSHDHPISEGKAPHTCNCWRCRLWKDHETVFKLGLEQVRVMSVYDVLAELDKIEVEK